jgi:hypothetical protein
MAGAVMADKKIDPHELRRQPSQRELQRQTARQKCRETNPDSDPTSEEPAGSPQTDKPKFKESDITGLKYFDKLAPLLERLHDDACERDKAGNRELHFDQYCLLILLYLFNPVVTSLRGIQQASELGKVQKKLGCQRAALGSLSEAATVFDADRLKDIIAELGAELKPLARDARLPDIDQTPSSRCSTRSSRRTAVICFYFLGVASEDELLAHLTKLKRQDEASSKKR